MKAVGSFSPVGTDAQKAMTTILLAIGQQGSVIVGGETNRDHPQTRNIWHGQPWLVMWGALKNQGLGLGELQLETRSLSSHLGTDGAGRIADSGPRRRPVAVLENVTPPSKEAPQPSALIEPPNGGMALGRSNACFPATVAALERQPRLAHPLEASTAGLPAT